RPQAASQPASPSPSSSLTPSPPSAPLPSPPSSPQIPSPLSKLLPSSVGSPAASLASATSASPLPVFNATPSSPLDDASVASDVSGESILNRLKELHCGQLFGSSSEESEEDDSEGLRTARPPSPTPSASGLFDEDSEEETEP
ncbi:hypothetical protein F443_22407, partial [Phytophthora nicotianae P1569]